MFISIKGTEDSELGASLDLHMIHIWQTYIIFIREISEAKLGGGGRKKSRWRDRNVNGMSKANQKKRGLFQMQGYLEKTGQAGGEGKEG